MFEKFDKIYCINLDKRADRWEKVSKIFNEVGITNVIRYSAVNGDDLDLSKINYNPSLLKGELGILETHLNLLQEAKDEGLKEIVIMEDDVVFTDEIYKFDEYLDNVPEDWDMIFVGGNHMYGETPHFINDKILKVNGTVAIHCIIIKESIMDVILEIAKNRKKQIDGYYADIQTGYNVYSFTPNMALQSEDFSDIQKRVVNYDNFLKK
jgi:GR25 family glycosyltransferase involved in LPS biosynthesis